MNEVGSGDEQRKLRVLVCDDHDLIRQALRAVINDEPDMEVVGEAADGEQAVTLACDLEPDAIVMDIQMPKLSGIEATRRIKAVLPNTTIIVLTIHDSNEYILRILKAGAAAYLTKGIISKEIPVAIRTAINGEATLSQEVLQKILSYVAQFPSGELLLPGSNLTPREIDVLALAAKGASNKTIAVNLNLTENTVKKYMMNVFDKLGVHSRTAAVIAAKQVGLLTLDDA